MEALRLNSGDSSVRVRRRREHLTPSEYGILETLLGDPGRVFSPEELYRAAWKAEPFDCRLIIAVHIRHLREKIEEDPSRPKLIRAAWGKGYLFAGNQASV